MLFSSRSTIKLFFNATSLPNDKFVDCTKFKGFADDNLNFAKMIISVLYTVENIAGKGENAGYRHVLLFPRCFQKDCSS